VKILTDDLPVSESAFEGGAVLCQNYECCLISPVVKSKHFFNVDAGLYELQMLSGME
jgi:hypothetical protein